MIERFYKRLQEIKPQYEWKLDPLNRIRGVKNSINHCPLTACYVEGKVGLSRAEKQTIIAAVDDKGDQEIRNRIMEIVGL